MKQIVSILIMCMLAFYLVSCNSDDISSFLDEQKIHEQAQVQEETKQEEIIEEIEQEEIVEEIKEEVKETKKEIDSEVLKTYKYWVVFFDHDGNELQREAIKWGTIPTYWSDTPYYEDGTHWYKFIGWKDRNGKDVKEFKPITGNTRFYAQYDVGGTVSHHYTESIPEPMPTPTPVPTPEPDPDYIQIDSLTSVPGAYINPQLTAADNMEFIFDAKLTNADGCRCFGNYASLSDGFLFQSNASGQLQYYNGNTGTFINNPGTLNQKATYDIKYSGNNSFVKVNGEVKSTFTTNIVSPNKDIYIFALNDGSPTGNDKKPLTMYYMKIYKDGSLVRDYIPVKTIKEIDKSKNATDPTSNIPIGTLCFYDKANQLYYPSSGPKTFSDNPDHLEVECLTTPGGTNGPCINTNIQSCSNMKFIYKVKMKSGVSSKPFGYFVAYPTGIGAHPYYNNPSQYGYEVYYGNYSNVVASNTVGLDQETVFEFQMKPNDNYLKAEDTVIYSDNDEHIIPTPLDIYIMAEKATTGTVSSASFSMYYFKMYINDELVRDYIPVYTTSLIDKTRNATNPSADIQADTYCVYDKLNDKYYINVGGGSFTDIPIS